MITLLLACLLALPSLPAFAGEPEADWTSAEILLAQNTGASELEQWNQLRRLRQIPNHQRGPLGSDRDLVDILRGNGSPEQRAAAASGLRGYVNSVAVRDALLASLASREPMEVRTASLKTLSVAGSDSRVQDALLHLADSASEEDDLRALAFKALYRMTNRADVRNALLYALRYSRSEVIRRGAAWGLFRTANLVDVRDALRNVMTDYREEEALRLEALKGLFNQMHETTTKDAIVRLVQDTREAPSLRHAGTLSLVHRAHESTIKRLLQDLMKNDPDSAVQTAAITALSGRVDYNIAAFFHLDTLPPFGNERDPLETK